MQDSRFLQNAYICQPFDVSGVKEFRDVAQSGSVLAWGARGRWFESSHPDLRGQNRIRLVLSSFFLIQVAVYLIDTHYSFIHSFSFPCLLIYLFRGYAELIRAFVHSDIKVERIIAYCKAVNNTAVTKRIGFLSEFFECTSLQEFTAFAKKQVNSKYNLIDPQGNEAGDLISEWKLRLNIGKEQLKDIANKQY